MQILYRILIVLCVLTLAACATPAQFGKGDKVPEPVARALVAAGMGMDALGMVAYPLSGDLPAVRYNADRSMQPGSTMKLLTAIVALDKLGINARGRTDLLTAVPLQGDVLPGALYLRGGADTDLDWGALWGMLRQLREQGVRHIQGGIVVDRSLFRPARLDIGAAPFDESPEFQYNAIPDALYLNGAMLDFTLKADAETFSLRTSPALPGLVVDASAVTLNGTDCAKWDDDWKTPTVQMAGGQPKITLQGPFPRNCIRQTAFNFLDRQWLAATLIRQWWTQLGGQLDGVDREGTAPATALVRVSHLGRPLAEVVRGMMKRSDNPLTRLLYLQLGAQFAQPEELTNSAAARTVRAWLASKNIAFDGLVLDNGSGLSRSERIQPAQMAALLQWVYSSPFAPELLSSLPIAGVDGTMSRRLKGTVAQGRARVKTGTLGNAVGIAGFVQDQSDRTWIVVGFVNHDQAMAKGRPVLDSLVEWVAGQP